MADKAIETATAAAPVAGSYYSHWPSGASASSDLKRGTFTQAAELTRQIIRDTTNAGALDGTSTALAVDSCNYGTLGAAGTVTFSGTPIEGSRITLLLTVSGATRTLTHPTVNRIGTNTQPTTTDLAVGYHKMVWEYAGSAWWQTDVGE
jgi:hypothetical protein